MTKIIHIAMANIKKHKGAVVSLFAIIMIVSSLTTIALSVLFEVKKDFYAGIERLHSLHSLFVMQRDWYEPAFEELIKNDPSVVEYEITEALSGELKFNYGGEIEWKVIIADLDKPLRISAPKIIERDYRISPEKAIYLPLTAKNAGYKIGDSFTSSYINKPFDFIVAGFFETNELSVPNMGALKFFVPNECYEYLSFQLPRNVWIAIRHEDPNISTSFVNNFLEQNSLETSFFGESAYILEFESLQNSQFMPMIFSVIIILFSMIIVSITLVVIRFRVTNNIDDTMREIGALKASGYTSRQITNCYLVEYGLIALPASLVGIIIPIPVFGFFRQVFSASTGFSWLFGINLAAGFITVLILVLILLLMVRHSCGRIKKLAPVDALRGGIAANNFRRNYFPLYRGMGNVHFRLVLKNIFAHFKFYIMIGVIIAGISIAITIIYVLFYNFSIDHRQIIRMSGNEVSDMTLSVTRQTDADVFAAELERMPEVRKTSMAEWITVKIDGNISFGYISNDYGKMEIMNVIDGRLPKYENEVALSKSGARLLEKQLGDSVMVKYNGVSLEYIITGFFSTMSSNIMITLEGFKRLDHNFKRSNIKIYLNDGEDYKAFNEKIKNLYGVLNVYRQEKSGKHTMAKMKAEEKISTYLERYAIDSVEYAVIYNDEIILSGSSNAYQIKTITNDRELLNSQMGYYSSLTSTVMRLITLVSLVIVSLILYMTVRSIVAKRRREMGILKANGFTSRQLARQLALSFLPAAGTGVITGCASGALLANPFLEAMFSRMGIYNASFTVNPIAIMFIGIVVLLVTYTVANISAARIKRISVYELISE